MYMFPKETKSNRNVYRIFIFLAGTAIFWLQAWFRNVLHLHLVGVLMFAATVLCFVAVGNFGIELARATLALKPGLLSRNDSPPKDYTKLRLSRPKSFTHQLLKSSVPLQNFNPTACN